jgi:hypothetical protein
MMTKSRKRKQPEPERFTDWELGKVIPLEPDEILVNDDPEGDPHKFARQGEPEPPPAPGRERP